jgi:hypothetical protein
MDILDNIVSNTKYKKDKKNNINFINRIVTNVGVFFVNSNITQNAYNEVKYMKVFGNIMEKFGFESFVNLEVLDVSTMDFIKQINPVVNILNEYYGKPKESVPKTELLQLHTLTNLKILKFRLKTSQEIMGNKRIKGDYSFLEFLPTNINTLIITGITNKSLTELNFTNLPVTITKIDLYKLPMQNYEKLKKNLIEHLKKYKYPFECRIYLDNVELELEHKHEQLEN